ncbi:MAG: class I SAM-dependent methyltransferase [Marmoricola sp.]
MSARDRGEVPGDAQFVGSIPEVYERLLVPLIFAEPAARLAETIAASSPRDVLETAAGTGVVTRALRERLPEAEITATDLNEAMMATARDQSSPEGVRWRQADALDLAFDNASFDAVACQFGVMFFPDRTAGYAEAKRVLRPGGVFVFNVWDSLAANPIAQVVADAMVRAAPGSPPQFLSRTPYGYFDHDQLRADVEAAGLTAQIEVCSGTNRGTAEEIATAFCQGTPLRAEIEAHPTLGVEEATTAATELLLQRLGDGVIVAPSSWIQVVAESA